MERNVRQGISVAPHGIHFFVKIGKFFVPSFYEFVTNKNLKKKK